MQYYCSLLVNKTGGEWMVYDWNVRDSYESVRRVPVIKITKRKMMDIMRHRISIGNVSKYMSGNGWILFVSTYDALAILFDNLGKELKRSRLLLEEEATIIDKYSDMPLDNVDISMGFKIPFNKDVRRAIMDKELLTNEINNIISSNNQEEARFLHYEWFGSEESNYDKIIKKLKYYLNNGDTYELHRMSELVKMFSN